MDWTKFNETIDLSKRTFDEPMAVFGPPQDSAPKQIYISSASISNTTYDWLVKEYRKRLDRVNQIRASDMCAQVPTYNFTIDEDGLTPTANEWPDEIVDKWNSIGCTSFMLTPEQIEQLLEQYDKENTK